MGKWGIINLLLSENKRFKRIKVQKSKKTNKTSKVKSQNRKSEKNQKSERKENPSFFFFSDFSFSCRPSLLLQPRRVTAQPALDALSLKSLLSPSLCQRAALSLANVESGTAGSTSNMLVDFYFQFFIASLLWICGYKL
jgi:hypothetical protein